MFPRIVTRGSCNVCLDCAGTAHQAPSMCRLLPQGVDRVGPHVSTFIGSSDMWPQISPVAFPWFCDWWGVRFRGDKMSPGLRPFRDSE